MEEYAKILELMSKHCTEDEYIEYTSKLIKLERDLGIEPKFANKINEVKEKIKNIINDLKTAKGYDIVCLQNQLAYQLNILNKYEG